jgi:hypothetical protein
MRAVFICSTFPLCYSVDEELWFPQYLFRSAAGVNYYRGGSAAA